jgi:hypothetical protein
VPPAGVGDRIWSLPTVVAAAIAVVALSGAGGAALAAVSDGGANDRGAFGRPGFGPPRQLNGQVPGQTPGQPGVNGVPGQPSATAR